MKFTYTFNLQMFAQLANGFNGTVTQGSTGALDTTGTLHFPDDGHAYAYPNNDLAPEMKKYYDKQLLELAKAKLVHEQFAQKRPIPKGSGKTIEFHMFDNLPLATAPITEGVTPDGLNISVKDLEATVEQYGAWVGHTDMLSLISVDNVVNETLKQLANQAAKTRDTLIRDMLQRTTNVYYASKKSAGSETAVEDEDELDGTATLSVYDIEKGVAILEGQDAPAAVEGDYAAFIHPYAAFDLRQDPRWEDINTYVDRENRLSGELGRIGGCRFFKSTNCKVKAPKEIANGYTKVTNKTTISSSTSTVDVKENLGPSQTGLSLPVYIGSGENTITAITTTTVGGVTSSSITLGTAITALAADATIVAQGGTRDGYPIYSTIMVGADAYGVSDLEGGALEMIVKQLGSGGTNDPLNQRASQGWKMAFASEILLPQYILNIESSSKRIPAQAN